MSWWKRPSKDIIDKELYGDYYCDGTMEDKNSKLNGNIDGWSIFKLKLKIKWKNKKQNKDQ
jgi:hypothetical protein